MGQHLKAMYGEWCGALCSKLKEVCQVIRLEVLLGVMAGFHALLELDPGCRPCLGLDLARRPCL
eukprot:2002-Chlamydomonas_euryale.AAC.1